MWGKEPVPYAKNKVPDQPALSHILIRTQNEMILWNIDGHSDQIVRICTTQMCRMKWTFAVCSRQKDPFSVCPSDTYLFFHQEPTPVSSLSNFLHLQTNENSGRIRCSEINIQNLVNVIVIIPSFNLMHTIQ